LRAFLKALKYGRRPDLPQHIDIVLAEAAVLPETDLTLILTYLDKGPIAVSNTVLREALQRLAPEKTEWIMGWITQPYYEKGRAEREAKLLVKLLEKRFGAVAAHLRERILASEVATIETWVDRLLDAPDLQSVFEAN
jgi:hypothetical protein